jgi:hypothetical protein
MSERGEKAALKKAPVLEFETIALDVLATLAANPSLETLTLGEEAGLLSEAQRSLLTTDWWAGEQALIIPPREELIQSLAKIFQAIAIRDALARKPAENSPEALP